MWQNGDRHAHACVWLEGAPSDEYQTVADVEGRTVLDGIRQWPQLELRTVLTYDGESERVLQAEVRQNGELREIHSTVGEVLQPDGSYRLLVKVIPAWGLARTNSYVLGDPFSRPVAIEFENGGRVNVVEWFADTSIAKVTESNDRHGRLIERTVLRPNAGIETGLLYDQVTAFRVSPWGDAGLRKTRLSCRGPTLLYSKSRRPHEFTSILAKPYQVSHWAADRTVITGCM